MSDQWFDIIPGDVESLVVIHVPHSSRVIPDDVKAGVLLGGERLEAELDAMTDAFTDVIASAVVERAAVRPWLFVNRVSRLVVDPERFPDEREEMNAAGMGAVYTRTSAGAPLREGSVDEISGLVDRFFLPYSRAFEDLVEQRLAAVGRLTIVDLHSYPLKPNPYEVHDGPRPEVCLGTDPFHTPDDLQEIASEAFSDFEIGRDSPFSGCYVPLTHHGLNPDVHALMIELRRDLYLDESFQLVELALAPIVSALTRLIDVADVPGLAVVTCAGMDLDPDSRTEVSPW